MHMGKGWFKRGLTALGLTTVNMLRSKWKRWESGSLTPCSLGTNGSRHYYRRAWEYTGLWVSGQHPRTGSSWGWATDFGEYTPSSVWKGSSQTFLDQLCSSKNYLAVKTQVKTENNKSKERWATAMARRSGELYKVQGRRWGTICWKKNAKILGKLEVIGKRTAGDMRGTDGE